ncbi:MAG: IS3 family transposase [Ruminiclostridium sp.]|nr:IS3 family transposase [Ruminiclostridium sp.]
MSLLFKVSGISKQSFHQMLKRRRYKFEEQEQLIPLINEIRRDHPRMSARDIYLKLHPACMGRDKFERFCMDSGYRIKQLRNFRVTTNSFGVTRFPNMIKDIECTHVNRVFVSDITYFDIGPDTYYLTFIMDLFNREIVGWSASDNLRTESTTLPALHRVISERGKSNLKGAIMHSDGGGQYYCNEFKKLTKELGMINSMTEEKVYENSHAERLNGIIKNNYLYPYGPTNMASLKKLLDKAVLMYNTGKPHKALGKLTPKSFKDTIDNEDNSSSNLPLSTVNHHHSKRSKLSNKKVNVI